MIKKLTQTELKRTHFHESFVKIAEPLQLPRNALDLLRIQFWVRFHLRLKLILVIQIRVDRARILNIFRDQSAGFPLLLWHLYEMFHDVLDKKVPVVDQNTLDCLMQVHSVHL